MKEKTPREKSPPRPGTTVALIRSPHVPTPANETADRDPLDLIAEEFAELCRRGKTPSVTEFLTRYPQHADDLKDLLPAVGQMESLKKLRKATSGDLTPLLEVIPERIGDYRILREIGRGGMGVVFEAEQESLGRKVALKILPVAARSDSGKRERFLREAQAAARLHHTNIVPVFGVGEENGIPYYVMQYIRGCGLDDIVHGWRNDAAESALVKPKDWRTIARLISKAADAMDYAHAEGVLHRDVKPANLLLDTTGHLWVTDFGLAKLLNEATQTATGHVLGTFQYMAPEALRGESDERTDVYGLGMTLYEMLTGRVPFDETNPAVLVKLIGEKEPPPPRTYAPKVPKDLETICLKAIAREPSRRYQSAGEFADDLRAYLVGRPISARRLSAMDRAWLWCRRNPEIAGLSAAVVAMLCLSTAFGWSNYAAERKARQAETAKLEAEQKLAERERTLRIEAENATTKYKDNLDLSLTAIEKILSIAGKNDAMLGPEGPGGHGAGPPQERGTFGPGERFFPKGPKGDREGPGGRDRPGGRDGPGGEPGGPFEPKGGVIRRDEMLTNNALLLDEILAFYEKFAGANEKNLKLKFDAARAYRRVGDIHFALGRRANGETAIAQAVRLLEELKQTDHNPEPIRRELELIKRRGEMRQRLGPPPDSFR